MENNFIAIHHVSMIISSLEQAKAFYHGILGLEIDELRPDLSFEGLWLNINSQQQIHLLLLDNPDPLERPEHGGRDRHVAFRVKHLPLIQIRLDKHDIPYTISQSERLALFCRDFDGNTLEIIQDA